MSNKKILFLNLTAFSQTGGIERFNKCFLKALSDLDAENVTDSFSLSAYDTECNTQYYSQSKYKGYAKNKAQFLLDSVRIAAGYEIIVLGHVNMALAGIIIKLLYPKKKIVLVTHGIDVWGELSFVKMKLMKMADTILSVSNFTKSKIVARHNISSDKIIVFHNTIDPYFPIPDSVKRVDDLRERYGIKNDDFVIYTLTRLSDTELYKGYDKVLEALKTLIDNYPRLKYVIAGKYSEKEKQRIDNVINEYKLNGHVILTGYVDERELVLHYRMADLYVMPSKKEGFGIVFIEALVCGLPVVAGNADGSVDALLNGKLGTLVNPDDVEEIATAIKKQLDDGYRNDEERLQSIKKETLDSFSYAVYKQRLRALVASY